MLSSLCLVSNASVCDTTAGKNLAYAPGPGQTDNFVYGAPEPESVVRPTKDVRMRDWVSRDYNIVTMGQPTSPGQRRSRQAGPQGIRVNTSYRPPARDFNILTGQANN